MSVQPKIGQLLALAGAAIAALIRLSSGLGCRPCAELAHGHLTVSGLVMPIASLGLVAYIASIVLISRHHYLASSTLIGVLAGIHASLLLFLIIHGHWCWTCLICAICILVLCHTKELGFEVSKNPVNEGRSEIAHPKIKV
jgi:hypothetical protein